MASKKKTDVAVDIMEVTKETVTFNIVGTSPFVCNAMSAKVRGGLLLPPPKKSRAEKEATLKHDPLEEYRQSAYRSRGEDEPTRIIFPAAGFKRAMANAALEIPGVNKSQMGRLLWAEGQYVSIYGIPQLWMAVVRQAGMTRAPDIRTRAIIHEWATTVTVSYVTPNLRRKPVVNLMASAGVFIGVGDGRPEKGALSFGQFEIADKKNERFNRVMSSGRREAQDAAFANPTMYDVETEELYEWWQAEVMRRGFEVA
jgi:hypothetical protein